MMPRDWSKVEDAYSHGRFFHDLYVIEGLRP
jgi:hypothetical protein